MACTLWHSTKKRNSIQRIPGTTPFTRHSIKIVCSPDVRYVRLGPMVLVHVLPFYRLAHPKGGIPGRLLPPIALQAAQGVRWGSLMRPAPKTWQQQWGA